MLSDLRKCLKQLANPEKARSLAGFFKTGRDQYGEGDVFLGIQVPDTRIVARRHLNLSLAEMRELLSSSIHEERLAALLILIGQYDRACRLADESRKREIFNFYVDNAKLVNNWDLVDSSAHQVLGNFLISNGRLKPILAKLAKSGSLWERRIAIVSTYAFIRDGRFGETFAVARLLLGDKHDLINKAVGWMLREVGKRDQVAEEKFLRAHCKKMSRTSLRYAIERFDKNKKKFYMKK